MFASEQNYDQWSFLLLTNSHFLYIQTPPYPQITPYLHPLHHPTPENTSPCPTLETCKNAQNTTYVKNHSIILYYYSMFLLIHTPGVFTFSVSAAFLPGWGCVPLKRRPPNPNHRFHTHFINCIKFSHNSLESPKTTSVPTSINP